MVLKKRQSSTRGRNYKECLSQMSFDLKKINRLDFKGLFPKR
nr:MAG TPA: hypothetical protein [Caudoviricetes sp.]